ncbi:unnamed protein product, partial [marine sediment metagenome]
RPEFALKLPKTENYNQFVHNWLKKHEEAE